jgi:hypothetical protein
MFKARAFKGSCEISSINLGSVGDLEHLETKKVLLEIKER